MSTKKRWSDLSDRQRRLIVLGTVVEGSLKAVALVDLAHRPADQVRGPKPLWAAALVVVSSVGALPIAYLAWGRHPVPSP